MPSRDNAHLYTIGLLALLWVATYRYGIGHVAPSGYCFAIGGGYIEYDRGWDWIRRKMICHSGVPPTGWFVHKLCSTTQRPYCRYYLGFRLPVTCLLIHDLLRRLESRGRIFKGNQQARPVTTFLSMLLLVALTYNESCFSFIILGLFALATLTLLPGFLIFMVARRRRPPTPPRCPCGYNLTGNVSGICPECGSAINVR